jgi:hypothetical protein
MYESVCALPAKCAEPFANSRGTKPADERKDKAMSTTPYDAIEPMQRWSHTRATIENGSYDPQGPVRFTFGPETVVASAGSCFAGRLAERMISGPYRYLVAEPAPAWLSPAEATEHGYLPFSARYGSIFSTLQLAQLIERAYGRFEPIERAWDVPGGFVDPFRPRISPEPFRTLAELERDRTSHFAAVRRMFEHAELFTFTLGLTEIWCDRRDGAVYPLCPGLAGGTFDPAQHAFHNTTVAENLDALERFARAARAVNPGLKIVLTVSPVPIGATAEAQHVARASTYTKSVLRAAAEEFCRAHDFADYFASYEMIAPSFVGDDPFEADRRHIRPDAIERVVQNFVLHYFGAGTAEAKPVEAIDLRPGGAVRPCDEDIFAR